MSEKPDYTKMGTDYCPACNYKCDSATAIGQEHITLKNTINHLKYIKFTI